MVFYCWTNVCDAGPTLNQHWRNVQHLQGSPPGQQTQNIFITFIQRRLQRLRRWFNIVLCHTNVLCLLGVSTSVGSVYFEIQAVIQSVRTAPASLMRSD